MDNTEQEFYLSSHRDFVEGNLLIDAWLKMKRFGVYRYQSDANILIRLVSLIEKKYMTVICGNTMKIPKLGIRFSGISKLDAIYNCIVLYIKYKNNELETRRNG